MVPAANTGTAAATAIDASNGMLHSRDAASLALQSSPKVLLCSQFLSRGRLSTVKFLFVSPCLAPLCTPPLSSRNSFHHGAHDAQYQCAHGRSDWRSRSFHCHSSKGRRRSSPPAAEAAGRSSARHSEARILAQQTCSQHKCRQTICTQQHDGELRRHVGGVGLAATVGAERQRQR